jgi:hypothetical protein
MLLDNWKPPAVTVHRDVDHPAISPDGRPLPVDANGKPDKAVALRFVSQKGVWRYEIHGIEGRVDLLWVND